MKVKMKMDIVMKTKMEHEKKEEEDDDETLVFNDSVQHRV